MSLVAYDYGSDEESDQEPEVAAETNKQTAALPTQPSNGIHSQGKPAPDDDSPTKHLKLPAPKNTNDLNVEEEDDEFLRKKAVPASGPLPAKPNVRNGKVQITIPSMKDFKDDESEGTKKGQPVVGAALPKKATNLLSLLPKPRTAIFERPVAGGSGTAASSSSSAAGSSSFSKRLVPDSVANRPRNVPMSTAKTAERRTASGEGKVIGSQTTAPAAAHKQDSEDEDDGDAEDADFFSFNKVEALPTVSANEISAMVAKKAAKMAETVRLYTEPEEQPTDTADTAMETDEPAASAPASDDLASETALAALIGGNRAKRARVEQVDLIEITSADIVPSKQDFLRRQLQDETGFVPTGHLVGDWTCTSKRKSHITQLASKAQANAQELEAMWAANRQSRRQTQSKYGF